MQNCTVGPRISDLDSSQDCLCLAVLRAWLAVAGFIACNYGMQMELNEPATREGRKAARTVYPLVIGLKQHEGDQQNIRISGP